MQAVTITQITPPELESLIETTLRKVLSQAKLQGPQQPTDELLTVQATAKFLSLSVPTVYGLISKGEIPVMKRSKRCYFSRVELINYLKQGRKNTLEEIAAERDKYLSSKKKGGNNG
jgi:excisionase family DNA binding protein